LKDITLYLLSNQFSIKRLVLRKFLFDFINKEREFIYQELKSNSEEKIDQILILLNLTTELAGLDLPFSEIIQVLLHEVSNLDEFRTKLLKKIHSVVKNVLTVRELGSTKIFDLKKMRHTQFVKYSSEILKIRKEEFEKSKILKSSEKNALYNVSELFKTYYGNQFSNILNLGVKIEIDQDIFNKIMFYASKLKLNLNIVEG